MLRRQEGFTVIEVLIVLFITGLVVSGIFSFLSFGNRTFSSGSEKSRLQQDLRLASENITREVRFATGIELTDVDNDLREDDPGDLIDNNFGDYCIYYDDQEKKLFLLDEDRRTPLSDEVITGAEFDVSGRQFEYDIKGVKRNAAYELESSVLLLNIPDPDEKSDFQAVWYEKPQ